MKIIDIKTKLGNSDVTVSYKIGKLDTYSAAALVSRILRELDMPHHSVVINEFDTEAEEQIKDLWNKGAKDE